MKKEAKHKTIKWFSFIVITLFLLIFIIFVGAFMQNSGNPLLSILVPIVVGGGGYYAFVIAKKKSKEVTESTLYNKESEKAKVIEPKEAIIETMDTKIRLPKSRKIKKLFVYFKIYLAEILLIIGVSVTLYNLLEPKYAPSSGNPFIRGYQTTPRHAPTELIILGVILVIMGIDIAIRRYIAKKNK